MKKISKIYIYPFIIMGLIIMLTNSCKKNDQTPIPIPTTVTDIDGNVYHFITIGTQVWMVENLKVTHYRNGDLIPNVTDNTAWSNLVTGAYCDYNNGPGISTTYGKLYNWYAVNDSRNIAPSGWHVPTDAEWTTLTTYWGGESIAGGKLKEVGTTHWQSPNTGATNESGFTALPGGWHSDDFYGIGETCRWWSSTAGGNGGWERIIDNYSAEVERSSYASSTLGLSVRCVKD